MEHRKLFNSYNIPDHTLDLIEEDFVILNGKELIVASRIDLIVKYIYIEAYIKKRNVEYAKNIYKAHIESFSHGTFKEAGQESSKNNIASFFDVFNNLIDDISINGFNASISRIPLDKDNILIDGAHRASISAYFEIPIEVSRFSIKGEKYDYSFFRKRMLSNDYLDYIVHQFIKIKKSSVFTMCAWPNVFSDKERIKEFLEQKVNVVYEKEIVLNTKGAHSFISQIYSHHNWVGTPGDMFSGAHRKADNCFGNSKNPLVLFVFETNLTLDEIIELKESLREKFAFGKHSIHITDNYRETRQISELLLNDNSIYHLNHGNPLKFPKSVDRLLQLKKYLKEENIDNDEVLIDASGSMEVFGIRKAKDIDFISEKMIPSKNDFNVRKKEELVKLYGNDIDKLNAPDNHFYYFELPFLTLSETLKSKKYRGEKKDIKDAVLLRDFLSNNKVSLKNDIIFNTQRKILFTKRRIKIIISKLLKNLGLFDSIKKLIKKK